MTSDTTFNQSLRTTNFDTTPIESENLIESLKRRVSSFQRKLTALHVAYVREHTNSGAYVHEQTLPWDLRRVSYHFPEIGIEEVELGHMLTIDSEMSEEDLRKVLTFLIH